MPSAASHGTVVFDYLKSIYPRPENRAEIMAATGLSYTQVGVGFEHIWTNLGLFHHEPLVYRASYVRRVPNDWVQHSYKLGESAAEVKDYGAVALGAEVKRLNNIANRLQAGAEKFGDTELDVLVHTARQTAATVAFVQKKLLGLP